MRVVVVTRLLRISFRVLLQHEPISTSIDVLYQHGLDIGREIWLVNFTEFPQIGLNSLPVHLPTIFHIALVLIFQQTALQGYDAQGEHIVFVRILLEDGSLRVDRFALFR